MKTLRKYIKQLFCEHKYQSDIQITFIRCSKCGITHYYQKDIMLFDKPLVKDN